MTLDTLVASGAAIDFGNNDGTLGQTDEPSDGVGTLNDDGSRFTIAAELTAGDTIPVNIYMQNGGVSDTSAVIELNVPPNIDAELRQPTVKAGGGAIGTNVVGEGQLARNKWLLIVAASAGENDDDGITLVIRPERLMTRASTPSPDDSSRSRASVPESVKRSKQRTVALDMKQRMRPAVCVRATARAIGSGQTAGRIKLWQCNDAIRPSGTRISGTTPQPMRYVEWDQMELQEGL